MILAKPNHPSPHVFILGQYLEWRKGSEIKRTRFSTPKGGWRYWTVIGPTELDTWKD